MRVVFDHQVFAFQKYGGISRYFVRLAQGLTARPGHSARIVAPLYVNAYLPDLPADSVRGHKIDATDFNQRVARNVDKRLARLLIGRENPDLVHETYYAAQSSAPRGVPTVLTVYDMIHEHFAETFAANDPTRELKRAAVLRADHILCISENTRRDLIAFIPEAEGKTSVTLLGFDSFVGEPAPQKAMTKPYLLYVGERLHYKNFAGLLQAYAGSPQLRGTFDIFCFGGSAPNKSELSMIHDLGIAEGAIRFTSGDDAALAACYRNAAAFVYPSLYEGFGIPPLEAMSASCPVIAANRSSIPEVCGDAAAYFNPDDSESMRIAIEQTVFDTDRRGDLVAKGLARLALFSWDQCIDATIGAYGRLL